MHSASFVEDQGSTMVHCVSVHNGDAGVLKTTSPLRPNQHQRGSNSRSTCRLLPWAAWAPTSTARDSSGTDASCILQ